MKPAELLDAVKSALSLSSDYELAKKMDLRPQHMGEYRSGKRGLPLDAAYRLAMSLELDPALVVADLECQREKNPERAEFWRNFLSREAANEGVDVKTARLVGEPSNLVGRVGVEPTTNGLRVRCSTN